MRPRAERTLLRLALLLVAGCGVEKIDLQAPPAPPPKGSYGACGAAPSVLARMPGLLPPLAIDEFSLYAVTAADDDGSPSQTLWQIPKDGSPPVTLATAPAITSFSVFANAYDEWSTGVVWTSQGPPDADGGASGAVWSIGLDPAGEPTVVVANRKAPVAVVATGTRTYWAEQSVDGLGNAVEAIMSAPTKGGPPTRIQTVALSEAPVAMAVTAPWYVQVLDASTAELYGGDVVWTTSSPTLHNEDSAEVIKCPLWDAGLGPLIRYGGVDAGGAGGIAVNLYDSLVDVSLAGAIAVFVPSAEGGLAESPPLLATAGTVGAFADDGQQFFFVQPGTKNLVAVPWTHPDAQAPHTVVTDVDPNLSLQVDGTCVYWVDSGTGTLVMVAE